MPDGLFGKTLREVYVNLLSGIETEEWNTFVRLVSVSSAYELKTRIDAAIATLKEWDESNLMSDTLSSFVIFSEELKRLEEAPVTYAADDSSQNIFSAQGKKMDKFELKAVSFP